jgi:membrane-associated phospholipid phosphatase
LQTLRTIVVAIAFALSAPAAAQNCGWSRIDHLVSLDNSGIWNPNVSRGITAALTIAQVGGAIWEGAESRFGRTMWQGIDSELIGAGAAEAGKYIFTRVRPNTEDNPCLWFQGGSNHSFPSGEAAVSAALVTPYVIEYGRDNPAAYLLLLLPLYTGVMRVKNQAHWQTDVLAGWAVGGLSGWYAHSRDVPIFIEILPHGFEVGFKKTF